MAVVQFPAKEGLVDFLKEELPVHDVEVFVFLMQRKRYLQRSSSIEEKLLPVHGDLEIGLFS
jgi:hypothetical protein